MGVTTKEMDYGMVEWVKHGMLRFFWTGNENEFVKRMYEGRMVGRPSVR